MTKYTVEFSYRTQNARGLHFKETKRTVSAKSEADAIRKIEQTLTTNITATKVTETTK